jgi:hypothetical protein
MEQETKNWSVADQVSVNLKLLGNRLRSLVQTVGILRIGVVRAWVLSRAGSYASTFSCTRVLLKIDTL